MFTQRIRDRLMIPANVPHGWHAAPAGFVMCPVAWSVPLWQIGVYQAAYADACRSCQATGWRLEHLEPSVN